MKNFNFEKKVFGLKTNKVYLLKGNYVFNENPKGVL